MRSASVPFGRRSSGPGSALEAGDARDVGDTRARRPVADARAVEARRTNRRATSRRARSRGTPACRTAEVVADPGPDQDERGHGDEAEALEPLTRGERTHDENERSAISGSRRNSSARSSTASARAPPSWRRVTASGARDSARRRASRARPQRGRGLRQQAASLSHRCGYAAASSAAMRPARSPARWREIADQPTVTAPSRHDESVPQRDLRPTSDHAARYVT